MRTTALALAVALACASTASSIAGSALADPPAAADADADAHFRRGVDLYKEADYRAALIEFRRADELAPAYQVLYDIAETSYQLQDYAGALKSFDRYLSEGGARIAPERRAEVEKEIAKLHLRVATVIFVTPLEDVDVVIDDFPAGKTPFSAPVIVSAGRRKIVASKAGRLPLTTWIDVAGGDTVNVPLALTEPPPPAPAPAPALEARPIAAPPREGPPVLPWLATGALAAGAAATGILALEASRDLRAKLAAYPASAHDITAGRSATRTLAIATDALTGAAVLLGGVSIYLTAARGAASAPVTKPGGARTLRLGLTPSGAQLLGTF